MALNSAAALAEGRQFSSQHPHCLYLQLPGDQGPTSALTFIYPTPIYLQLKIIKTSLTNIVLAEENKHFSKRLETGGSGWSPDVGNRRMPGNPAY